MGLPVIGMIKEMKQRYQLNGKLMTLKELYATLPKNKNSEILGFVITETSCGLPVKLVFVQNRNKRREWLAILSTDLAVSADEIVRIYNRVLYYLREVETKIYPQLQSIKSIMKKYRISLQ